MMRVAIIDLGTNTFNLLIADITEDKKYNIVFTDKAGVKLGKGGINNQIITPDAFQRALDGISKHLVNIQLYKAEKIVATATSGIRSTKNGHELVAEIEKQFGIQVIVVSGDDEAELIYRGVKQVVPFDHENVLILDIGGGSTEFIIANHNGLLWKQSFELGIARLLDRFNPSDPITNEEIHKVEQYIDSELTPLYDAYNKFNPVKLIGSSGTFDSIRSLIIEKNGENHNDLKKIKTYTFSFDEYNHLHKKLIQSTYEQRLKMKGLELVRVEMIVLASIFVNFIINKFKIKTITQSSYALKEGMLDKIING